MQRRSVSAKSGQPQTAHNLVENRPVTASASFGDHSASASSTQSAQAPALSQECPQTIEARRFSSNNPYGKVFHAFSPVADVAIDSPLACKSSAPLTIQVPPRLISKRASLPLLHTSELEGASKEEAHDVEHINKHWPLKRSEHSETPNGKSDHGDQDDFDGRTTTMIDAISSGNSGNAVDAKLTTPLSNLSLAGQDMTAQDAPTDEWVHDSETGYRTKVLAWKPEQPGRGPVLRIHKDADY
ncbi:MAG: hypothetical protein EOO38_32145, partial [Cytophagaceae bacterium]